MLATLAFLTAALLGLFVVCNKLALSAPLLRQLLRSVHPPASDYTALTPAISDRHNSSVLFYMPVGCTFDPHACGYFRGCSAAYKFCDQSSDNRDNNSRTSMCDVNLPGSFDYQTLADKNQAIIRDMCSKKMYEQYDVFVKVDDDLLFDPEHTRDVLSRLDLPPLSLLGYLHRRESGLIWLNGFFYAFTSDLLRKLCHSENALLQIRGKFEDVAFAMAVKRIYNVCYYNLDDLLHFHHVSYKSSRLIIQFIQYGSCRPKL
ncbi:hypothetical protein H4R24_004237 [Coemansia sp. RSA 988]|nr:hypothetical protein H4R24_004237 [Coemansia sp. RSA 988]